MGAHNLGVSELTIEDADKKGDAYLEAVWKEQSPEHIANEGSKEDNAMSSDKMFKVKKK